MFKKLEIREDSREVQESNTIAAFFDLDNTILEMHTMILFARYLTKVGRVSSGRVDAMLERVKLMERLGGTREITNGIFFSILEGMLLEDYLDLGFQWWSGVDRRFVAKVYAEFESLRASGAHVIAISGSYSCCVHAISETLGMTAGYGSVPQVSDGILTGGVEIAMVGEEKKKQLLKYVSKHSDVITATRAYGDHPTDFPMLSAVDDACFIRAAETDQATLTYVTSKGWRVLNAFDSSTI